MRMFISFKSFVTKVDYCNFLLFGLSQNQIIQRFQYIQNSAACVSSLLVLGLKYDSIILRVPIAKRITLASSGQAN